MKLLLLKILLQRRARDEGFTLPMVIALGLVMLLLGAINITIANEENITAISQNSRSDALAVAEVGVARFRELLDRNRVLTINDHSQWGALAEVCDDNIASLVPTPNTPPAPPTLSWQNVVDSQDLDNDGNTTEFLGSYSLDSYEYNLTSGSDNFDQTDDTNNVVTVGGNIISATGTLTVRGRAADNSGEAQIEVDIPIRINLADMTNLAPALWIGDDSVSAADLTPLTVSNGNVVIRDPAVTTAGSERDGCRDFSSLASTTPRRPVVSDSRDLPSIQQVIDDVAAARTAHSVAAGNPINTPLVNAPDPGQLLFGSTQQIVAGNPNPVDTRPYNPEANTTNCPNIKLCRYYYDNFTTGTYIDTDLLTDGVARTTLLFDESLTVSVTSGTVKIGSTSNVVNDSNAFEIYVMDDDADPTNGSANNITLNATGGNITVNGFIHAPQSTLTITGSGDVTINGSVWVGDFVNNSTGNVTISPDIITRLPTASDPSTSGRAYKFYSTTPSRTARPLTGSPTVWKTEQIN